MSIKRGKNGKWYVSFRYKDSTGKTKQKKKEGLATKREAVEWQKEFLLHEQLGANSTFDVIAEEYLMDLSSHCKPTTIENRKVVFRCNIFPRWQGQRIADISANDIRLWRNDLLKTMKPSTVLEINSILASFFYWAERYYNIPNPIRKAGALRLPRKSTNQDLLFWTYEQYKFFIQQVTNDEFRVACDILYWTGLRRGEACGLLWQDVDLEDKVIHVRRNRVYLNNQFVDISPKTLTSNRDVAIPQRLADELKAWREKQYKPNPTQHVLIMSPHALSHRFLALQRKLGITPCIHIHSLRHSHASLLIEMGYSMQAIADRLGHANTLQVQRTYGHLYPKRRREIADGLDKLD